MKKILLFVFSLFILFCSCKKTPTEFSVSEINTLKELTTPGTKEEIAVNKQVTFYIEVVKMNKPAVTYTLKETTKANPDLLIASGTIDKVMSGKTLSLNYTPTQSNVLTTLQLRVVCGNEIIHRFKDFVAK
ncbi:hypothetical protein [uncultured Mucilaginibacter sp.]|uniref:hypothetical protein n=1 Tax=uncultured Mucilaginibacter sp. TaxID=797541 RepID=UPI0026195C31|nr:hypothetical protein [uncultured Mucilaginibacter sp.]